AMVIPVVTCDLDPAAVEILINLCAEYDRIRREAPDRTGADGRTGADDGTVPPDGRHACSDTAVPAGSGPSPAAPAEQAGRAARVLAMLEHQILAAVLQVVSGPGGVASFLRRNLMGKGLNGPSLPLDVGQTDDIPVHLRRLVALRDPTCQFP